MSLDLTWSLVGGYVAIRFLPPLPWGPLFGEAPYLVLVGQLWLINSRAVRWAFWLGGPEFALSLSGVLCSRGQEMVPSVQEGTNADPNLTFLRIDRKFPLCPFYRNESNDQLL